MKIVCVDPIAKTNGLCSLSVFDCDGHFLLQRVIDIEKIPIDEKHTYVCYDLLNLFEFSPNFNVNIYDVKIIYELQNKKFNNLTRLGLDIFGSDYMYQYTDVLDKVQAHLRSYMIAKINKDDYSYKELIPDDLLRFYYKERACLIVSLFDFFNKSRRKDVVTKFYPTLRRAAKNLSVLERSPVDVSLLAISNVNNHYASAIRKHTKDDKLWLKYNVVGAKTGRLTFKKESINFYGIPRELRNCVVAQEDYKIVQFDFKSFQPRLAIFSTSDEEFKNKFKDIEDIYSVFSGDRSENKIEFLAWMFSVARKNKKFETEAKPIDKLRKELYSRAKKDKMLVNLFGRPLFFEEVKVNVVFQNYITSLEVDVILDLLAWFNNAMKSRSSRVLMTFHDAIIFQIHKDEMRLIDRIKDYMEVYGVARFGTKFPVEVKIGDNFGEMR